MIIGHLETSGKTKLYIIGQEMYGSNSLEVWGRLRHDSYREVFLPFLETNMLCTFMVGFLVYFAWYPKPPKPKP